VTSRPTEAPSPIDPRAALLAAAREFNSGRYFEAHEALEEALDDLPTTSGRSSSG
jgi:cytochrome c-type biogenesis protein CcmH/NrfG